MNNQKQNNTKIQERTKVNDKIQERIEDEVIVDDTMYKILLVNNDNTSVQAVLDVLVQVFQHQEDICMRIMMDAHTLGQAIVWIDTQQNCEAKLREAQVYCGQLSGETMEGLTLDDGNNRPHYYQELEFRMEVYEENQE